MHPRNWKRSFVRVSILTGLTVLVVVGAGLVFVDTRPESAKARAWAAEAAAGGQLTDNLDEFIRLPAAYRVHAKALMSPEQHSRLWRAWLDRFEAKTELNPEQEAFLQELRALVVPALYDSMSPERPRLKAQLSSLCSRELDLFTSAQVVALRNIGPPATGSERSGGYIVRVVRSLESVLGIAAVSATACDDCGCNHTLSQQCGSCENPAELCKDKCCWDVYWNCGCLGEDTCIDLCEAPGL